MIRSILLASLLFWIRAAVAQDPPDVMHARQSYEYSRDGQLPEAEREIREAIRLAPANPFYRSALAGILQRAGKLEEAGRELAHLLDSGLASGNLRPQIADRLEKIYLDLGSRYAAEKRFQAGLPNAREAARRFPQTARVLQMLGFFEAKCQLNVDAVKAYSEALKLDPSSAEVSVGLAVAQSAAGMRKAAMRTLESGLAHFPGDPLHYQALGVLLLQTFDSDAVDIAKARSMFESALRIDPALGESHYQLGNLALRDGDSSAAIEHFSRAARAMPADSRVHFALARVYRREGRKAEAQREMAEFENLKTEDGP